MKPLRKASSVGTSTLWAVISLSFWAVISLSFWAASAFAQAESDPVWRPFQKSGSTYDLKSVYQTAVEKTQSVPIQQARVEQSQARVSQATGGILPSVALNASYLRQDQPESISTVSSNFALQNQTNARITATQPLFRGFREFAGLNAVKAERRAQEATEVTTRLQLYTQVAQAYYNVLAAEQDLFNIKNLLELTEKRVTELQSRTKIGRSRRGELLAAQAQVATLKAQAEAGEATVLQAREQFELTTGLPRTTTLVDNSNDLPEKVDPLETLMAQIENRPDIEAAKALVESTESQIRVAKGGHLPSLDLTGNYHLKRMGILQGIKWDVGVTLTFPIFSGGIVNAQVREASARNREQELTLAQARRSANNEIRALHHGLASSLDQVRSFKKALTIAEQNYHEQTRDYRFGLVTNLDVLQALNTFQETKRSFDRTRYQAKFSQAALQSALGKLP